jgi:hypothetical protein
MTHRVSNQKFLTILSGEPSPRIGLSVEVFDAADYNQLLAILNTASKISYTATRGQTGGGLFVLSEHDQFAVPDIIRHGNLIRMRVNGIVREAWTIEQIKENLISTAEGEGEVLEVSGRGLLALLSHGEVYPDGWPTVHTNTPPHYIGTSASIFLAELARAKGRGACLGIVPTFTDTIDSAGNPWTDTQDLSPAVGTNLLDLWFSLPILSNAGDMTPTLRLRAYVAGTRDLSQTVIMRKGRHIVSDYYRQGNTANTTTHELMLGSNNVVLEASDPDLAAVVGIGRR